MNQLKEVLDKYKEDLEAALKENEVNTRRTLVHDVFKECAKEMEEVANSTEPAMAPVVDLGGKFSFAESRYVRGKCGWLAASLYKKVEKDGLKPFYVPLASIELSVMPFKCSDLDSFIWHMRRCMNADTNIPILLDDYGQIADGYHRVASAILKGKKYIKAYRLTSMPPVDFNEDEDA